MSVVVTLPSSTYGHRSAVRRLRCACAAWLTSCLVLTLVTLVGLRASATAASESPFTANTIADPVLLPGDVLQIAVFNHPDMSAEACVDARGTITLPYIGEITGLLTATPTDLSQEVTKRLQDGYLRNPAVEVSFKAMAARQALVTGAVVHPTPIILDPRQHNTVLQAIMLAGGFTDVANSSDIYVLRDDPDHPDGDKRILTLPPAGSRSMRDMPLQINDIIVVPHLNSVTVLGQVVHPGTTILPGGFSNTLSSVIAMAGGFSPYAKTSAIRLSHEGTTTEVNMKHVLSGYPDAKDPLVQPGDFVFVPESRF